MQSGNLVQTSLNEVTKKDNLLQALRAIDSHIRAFNSKFKEALHSLEFTNEGKLTKEAQQAILQLQKKEREMCSIIPQLRTHQITSDLLRLYNVSLLEQDPQNNFIQEYANYKRYQNLSQKYRLTEDEQSFVQEQQQYQPSNVKLNLDELIENCYPKTLQAAYTIAEKQAILTRLIVRGRENIANFFHSQTGELDLNLQELAFITDIALHRTELLQDLITNIDNSSTVEGGIRLFASTSKISSKQKTNTIDQDNWRQIPTPVNITESQVLQYEIPLKDTSWATALYRQYCIQNNISMNAEDHKNVISQAKELNLNKAVAEYLKLNETLPLPSLVFEKIFKTSDVEDFVPKVKGDLETLCSNIVNSIQNPKAFQETGEEVEHKNANSKTVERPHTSTPNKNSNSQTQWAGREVPHTQLNSRTVERRTVERPNTSTQNTNFGNMYQASAAQKWRDHINEHCPDLYQTYSAVVGDKPEGNKSQPSAKGNNAGNHRIK